MTETKTPDISVVIISFNTENLTRECLKTLKNEAGGLSLEIFVVDNASKDKSVAMIRQEFPEVHLICSDVNLGFAKANNKAFPLARGKYILLLNTDAFIQPGMLKKSLDYMETNQTIGIGGARLIGRDGAWQPSARMFPSLLNDFLLLSGLSSRYEKSRFFGRVDRTWADQERSADVDWIPGAYQLIRREALEKAGYFDERFFLYYEEVDLCRGMKQAGYRVHYWGGVVCVHIGGESSKTVKNGTMSKSGSQLTLWRMRSTLLYYRKNHGPLVTWIAKEMEIIWHRLRAGKNAGEKNPEADVKVEDSWRIVDLMRQAWKETRGGTISPPRPW